MHLEEELRFINILASGTSVPKIFSGSAIYLESKPTSPKMNPEIANQNIIGHISYISSLY